MKSIGCFTLFLAKYFTCNFLLADLVLCAWMWLISLGVLCMVIICYPYPHWTSINTLLDSRPFCANVFCDKMCFSTIIVGWGVKSPSTWQCWPKLTLPVIRCRCTIAFWCVWKYYWTFIGPYELYCDSQNIGLNNCHFTYIWVCICLLLL